MRGSGLTLAKLVPGQMAGGRPVSARAASMTNFLLLVALQRCCMAARGLALNLTQSPYRELRMVPNPAVLPVQLSTLTETRCSFGCCSRQAGPHAKAALVPCQQDYMGCICLKALLKQALWPFVPAVVRIDPPALFGVSPTAALSRIA